MHLVNLLNMSVYFYSWIEVVSLEIYFEFKILL